ncbi:MAG: copper oxidase [bacterium]
MSRLEYKVLGLMALLALFLGTTGAGWAMDRNGSMRVKFPPNTGMIVNENSDTLPHNCSTISETRTITVRAGRKFAESPSTVFTYARNEWQVKPCSKLIVTFVNDDPIRHQWMVHGLPEYLYPMGMFTLEVTGPNSVTGSFVVPGNSVTLLAHCDIPTHTERGMKALIKVGDGDGDLPNVPGITGPRQPDPYPIEWNWLTWTTFILGLLSGTGIFFAYRRL